jgi:archaellum component FlaC
VSSNFKSKKKNKRRVLSEYVKDDHANKKIVKNVIDEQINQKKDSMEDISFNIMNKKCKKQNIAKMLANHFSSVASGEMRTTDIMRTRA